MDCGERGVGFPEPETPRSPSAHDPLVRGSAKAEQAHDPLVRGSAKAEQAHDPLVRGSAKAGR
jgi:hypothetical protein